MKQSVKSLMQELENYETTDQRRREIGEWLAESGDTRPGISVKDGIPDIVWLPVTPGGEVKVVRAWYPETPDQEARVTQIQYFDVEPFYIAKYLVTYAQYQAFIKTVDGFDNLTWWQGMPEAVQCQRLAEQHIKKHVFIHGVRKRPDMQIPLKRN